MADALDCDVAELHPMHQELPKLDRRHYIAERAQPLGRQRPKLTTILDQALFEPGSFDGHVRRRASRAISATTTFLTVALAAPTIFLLSRTR